VDGDRAACVFPRNQSRSERGDAGLFTWCENGFVRDQAFAGKRGAGV
jgi:hypothetical protein